MDNLFTDYRKNPDSYTVFAKKTQKTPMRAQKGESRKKREKKPNAPKCCSEGPVKNLP